MLEWRKINQQGEDVPAHPPRSCYDAIHARGEWPGIRPLAGVVESPVLRPDGSVVETPGYDPCTGLLYESSAEFPPVPDNPPKEDAKRAVEVFDDLVSEFPFIGGEHRAVWLAGLLTVFARPAFTGPAPLFLFEASAAGSGKTLLVEISRITATGREPPVSELSTENEEVRKAINAPLGQAFGEGVDLTLAGAGGIIHATCDLLEITPARAEEFGPISCPGPHFSSSTPPLATTTMYLFVHGARDPWQPHRSTRSFITCTGPWIPAASPAPMATSSHASRPIATPRRSWNWSGATRRWS